MNDTPEPSNIGILVIKYTETCLFPRSNTRNVDVIHSLIGCCYKELAAMRCVISLLNGDFISLSYVLERFSRSCSVYSLSVTVTVRVN